MFNPLLLLFSLALLTHADPTSNVPIVPGTITVFPKKLMARDEATSNVPLSFETITVFPKALMPRDSTTNIVATLEHVPVETAKLEPRATAASLPRQADTSPIDSPPDMSPIDASPVVARATASLPNGAEVESGEGIRRKAVGADFAPREENGGVVRGVEVAMIFGLAVAAVVL